jgi:molybdenum cofactor synthesis domain-containing protein
MVPDDRPRIEATLQELAGAGLDLVLTTGGTGLGPRDVTPEATLAVVDRLVPGLAEAMRQESLKKTPHAMLSRGIAGVRGRTLIVNLPGSPRAVRECFAVIAPVLTHAVDILGGGGHESKG